MKKYKMCSNECPGCLNAYIYNGCPYIANGEDNYQAVKIEHLKQFINFVNINDTNEMLKVYPEYKRIIKIMRITNDF